MKKYIQLAVITNFIFAQNLVLSLDGDNDYVSLPNIIVDSPIFTVEAWAYMSGMGGGIKTANIIFQQRDDITSDNRSAVLLYPERYIPSQYATLWVRSDQNTANVLETESPAYGEWHHYAGVIDYTTIYFYIDGQLVDSETNVQTGSYSTSIDYVDIGRHRFNLADQGFFNGFIDEIRIWDTALTQSEIYTMMDDSLSGNENNLIAYWNFEDGTAQDGTQNGNNGVLHGDASIIPVDRPALCLLPGDANSDTGVDVLDIVNMVAYILGEEPDPFNFFCGDCNQDASINILDIVCVVDIIL